MSNEITTPHEVSLPQISSHTKTLLKILTQTLGVQRSILPSDKQIEHVWSNLPRLLSRIPPESRSEGLISMCIAVANGLFDSSINYAWNAAIIELKGKVRRFGIHIIPQIIDKDFDESNLSELQDSQLLDLCLKLNLISVDGYFMLDQCRNIRNNFSTAHPTIGKLDEDELINFVNRVSKYALNNEKNPKAVDIQELIKAIQGGGFSKEQYQVWCDRISNTFDAQREVIFGMLHGIYCDPSKDQETRENSIEICSQLVEKLTPSVTSLIINRHQDYRASGYEEKYKASQIFFQKLGLIKLLSEKERHHIVSNACKKLLSVHNGYYNFYNEPPFAKRVADIVENQSIPETTQEEFVETVLLCAVGNAYGTSQAAERYYTKMIQGFSEREVKIMLDLPEKHESILAKRIEFHDRCKVKFSKLVGLINQRTVTTAQKSNYKKWIKLNKN